MKIRQPGYHSTRFLRAGSAIARVMRDDPNNKKGEGGGGDDDEVAKLKAKNAKLVEEEKKMRARLKSLEDESEERKTKEAEAEAERQRKAGDFAKIEEGLKAQIAAEKKKAADLQERFNGVMIDTALGSALDAAGVASPIFRKAALSMLKTGNKFDISDENVVSVGGVQITDFMKTWAGTEEGKSFIKNGNGGGGSNQRPNGSGGGGNPVTGNMGGSAEERRAALREKFPELNPDNQ